MLILMNKNNNNQLTMKDKKKIIRNRFKIYKKMKKALI